jgi:phytanoyl-CoA hydroxylase
MQLSREQVTQFQENGFIILRDFVHPSVCEAILEVANRHLQDRVEPLETEAGYAGQSKEERKDEVDYSSHTFQQEETIRRLRQVYQRDPHFRIWMENEEIRPILKQLLNDEVVIVQAHHNSIMTKMPHCSTQTRWHQDRRYWHYSDNNLISVWLALDSEYNDNGVLEFIPGSHKMTFRQEQFDEKEYFSEDVPLNKELIATKVSTTLGRGDVVIFHSLLLHRANKNITDKPKISFVYTVKGLQTKAIEGSRSASYPEILLT